MPRQQSFTVIPNPLGMQGLLSRENARAPIKPPMTSKQIQKAYRAANRQPRMSKTEARRTELMEQQRIRKDLEKEKAANKARMLREKKKAKDLEALEARKRKGLPLVDVRPSQDTISRFVKGNAWRRRREGEGAVVRMKTVTDEERLEWKGAERVLESKGDSEDVDEGSEQVKRRRTEPGQKVSCEMLRIPSDEPIEPREVVDVIHETEAASSTRPCHDQPLEFRNSQETSVVAEKMDLTAAQAGAKKPLTIEAVRPETRVEEPQQAPKLRAVERPPRHHEGGWLKKGISPSKMSISLGKLAVQSAAAPTGHPPRTPVIPVVQTRNKNSLEREKVTSNIGDQSVQRRYVTSGQRPSALTGPPLQDVSANLRVPPSTKDHSKSTIMNTPAFMAPIKPVAGATASRTSAVPRFVQSRQETRAIHMRAPGGMDKPRFVNNDRVGRTPVLRKDTRSIKSPMEPGSRVSNLPTNTQLFILNNLDVFGDEPLSLTPTGSPKELDHAKAAGPYNKPMQPGSAMIWKPNKYTARRGPALARMPFSVKFPAPPPTSAPTNTQAFLESHLDEIFPTATQEARELQEIRRPPFFQSRQLNNAGQMQRGFVRQEAFAVERATVPGPAQVARPMTGAISVPLFSTQDLVLSTQDILDVEQDIPTMEKVLAEERRSDANDPVPAVGSEGRKSCGIGPTPECQPIRRALSVVRQADMRGLNRDPAMSGKAAFNSSKPRPRIMSSGLVSGNEQNSQVVGPRVFPCSLSPELCVHKQRSSSETRLMSHKSSSPVEREARTRPSASKQQKQGLATSRTALRNRPSGREAPAPSTSCTNDPTETRPTPKSSTTSSSASSPTRFFTSSGTKESILLAQELSRRTYREEQWRRQLAEADFLSQERREVEREKIMFEKDAAAKRQMMEEAAALARAVEEEELDRGEESKSTSQILYQAWPAVIDQRQTHTGAEDRSADTDMSQETDYGDLEPEELMDVLVT